jgi:acetyl-CoA acetyltransferase
VTAVAIHGVGTSQFAKQPERTPADLAVEAASEALADAGIEGVDAAYVGTVFGAPGVAQRALRALGLTEIPIVTIEAACASGTLALHEAHVAVSTGRYERVLALGVEQLSTAFAGPIEPEPTDAEGRAGMLLPAIYAMSAARYQAVHSVTDAELASVAVKNSRHGAHNPRALRRRALTPAEILGSAPVAEPLTLLQCCSLSDAAAAAVVAPATGRSGEVRIRSSALRSGGLWDQRSDHAWGFAIVRDTAHDAYEASGIGIDDVDVLEVHDAFTIGEIVTTEALGLADEGRGGALALSGDTALGGSKPVNPSGGLLSRGHPLGATGLAQTAEIVWQLRAAAGERQVDGARIGLVETMGGGASGLDGNACVVAILEGGAR